MPGISESVISAEALEEAAKEVEKLLAADSQYAELSGKLRVTSHSECVCMRGTTIDCGLHINLLMYVQNFELRSEKSIVKLEPADIHASRTVD